MAVVQNGLDLKFNVKEQASRPSYVVNKFEQDRGGGARAMYTGGAEAMYRDPLRTDGRLKTLPSPLCWWAVETIDLKSNIDQTFSSPQYLKWRSEKSFLKIWWSPCTGTLLHFNLSKPNLTLTQEMDLWYWSACTTFCPDAIQIVLSLICRTFSSLPLSPGHWCPGRNFWTDTICNEIFGW